MSAVTNPNDIAIIWWAIGGLSATFIMLIGASFGYQTSALHRALRDIKAEHEALWGRITGESKNASSAALAAEQRFVNKSDVDQMEKRLLDRIDVSDKLMTERIKRMLIEALHRPGGPGPEV